MKELELLIRLLAAVHAAEEKAVFDPVFVDERILKAPPAARDRAALKAMKAGYLDGLHVINGIDGQEVPYIAWEYSKPFVTMQGLEYLDDNAIAKRVLSELKETAISLAAQTVGAVISSKL